MKPVAWAFAQPCFSRVTFVMGTQMGKSVTMENICGHRLDEDPTPIMYVGPTAPLLKNTVVPKFMDMINGAASLLKKLDAGRSSTFVKWLAGTKLRFAWAGSPTELAADSAGLILVDEVDRIVNTSEGDTTEIIEARGDAYVDSKVGYTATPTAGKVERRVDERTGLWHWQKGKATAIRSKIWQLWQAGTRHEWAIPCPHCGEYFIPSSDLLWWPGKGSEDECTPDEAEKHARLQCPGSGCQIEDKWRPWMNTRGVAVAPGERVTKAGQIEGTADTAGFTHYSIWISGLCSFAAKKSYGFLAKKLLSAQVSGDPATLQGVLNTGFGECYAEAGDVPTWEEVKGMRYGYAEGELILPPKKIYCTVDVQKNRLVYVVRAWYAGHASALVEHGELWGDTDQGEVWDALGELIGTEYDGHVINETGVDIGYRDDKVYEFINLHKGRVVALRGREKLEKPFKKELVEVSKQGKVRKRGDARWAFDSPLAKRWVHSRFGQKDTRTGWWVIHQQVTDDYCRQLVGEEWSEADGCFRQVGENHYLDCEAMQYIMSLRDKIHRTKRGALTKAQLKDAVRGASEEAPSVELEDEQESAAPEPTPVAPRSRAAPEPEKVAPAAKKPGRFRIKKASR